MRYNISGIWFDEHPTGWEILIIRGKDYRRFRGVSIFNVLRLLEICRKMGFKQYDHVNFENCTRYVYFRGVKNV